MQRARLPILLCLLSLCLVAPLRAEPANDDAILGLGVAASLREVVTDLTEAHLKAGGCPVIVYPDATSKIARMIDEGAGWDVYIGADQEWTDWLAERQLIVKDSQQIVARNTLVAVVPKDAKYVPGDAKGLTDPALRFLALAGEEVPAGRYAFAALEKAQVWTKVKDRVVRGANVRATLAYVAQGEAEAGVVYATDAKVEPNVQVAFTFPADSHPPITYPAAVIAASKQQERAAAFIRFCRGPEGRAVFAKHGFLPPGDPKR